MKAVERAHVHSVAAIGVGKSMQTAADKFKTFAASTDLESRNSMVERASSRLPSLDKDIG